MDNAAMDNAVTEVPLRKRSTPYTFSVVLTHEGRTLQVYNGASANYASSAYWQAISTLSFLHVREKVDLVVKLSKKPYGAFVTEPSRAEWRMRQVDVWLLVGRSPV